MGFLPTSCCLQEAELPFGACVWATGVAMHPVVKILSQKLPDGTQVQTQMHQNTTRQSSFVCLLPTRRLVFAATLAADHILLAYLLLRLRPRAFPSTNPACLLVRRPPAARHFPPACLQTHFRSAITDDWLRVKGSDGTMFALGDAATIEQAKVGWLKLLVQRFKHATSCFKHGGEGRHGLPACPPAISFGVLQYGVVCVVLQGHQCPVHAVTRVLLLTVRLPTHTGCGEGQ